MPTGTAAVIESTNADRSKRRLRSAAPPRPPLRTIAIAFTGALVGLTGLAALTYAFGLPLLIPPLAASMALIVGAPKLPLAQPRNVIGGQVLSATTGAVVGLFGHSLWLGALAGAVALAAMTVCRMPHSPAAATAVIGATSTAVPGWEFVLLAGVASLILVIVGFATNRGNGVRDHPVYIW